ncbi:MAG: YciI family protein [Planctomycetia bacterium]
MRYMLLVYSPESAWTPEEWTACTVESTAVCRDLQAKGWFVAAAPLHPVATAATVRVRNGQSLVTAGPFAETTEQLGGFFLIDAPNLDDAITVAARLPSARKGTIEVRPLAPLEGLPAERFDVTGPSRSRYMLLCYDDEQIWNEAGPAALKAAQSEAVDLTRRLDARGQYLSASPLHSAATAASLRIRDGRRIITDGPFAETREFLGGYYLIFARDLNEAVSVAVQHPGARVSTVEVRRLVDLPMPSAT